MFYAGIDMLFSILFPILFLVVLGMILYTIIVLSVWWRETSVRFATTVAGTVSCGEWLFLFHVLIFPMMVYRIIPKTTRNRMGNRMLNNISIPA